MSEKENKELATTISTAAPSAAGAPEDPNVTDKQDEFAAKLDGLPEKYRDEILRQYALPEANASMLTILRCATWYETLLMVIGTLASAASGCPEVGVADEQVRQCR